jgi:hypothetical protein
MAIRIGVQADSRDECVEALAQLVAAGFVPIMLPAQVTDDRWLARAVPAPNTKAPTETGRGSVVSG